LFTSFFTIYILAENLGFSQDLPIGLRRTASNIYYLFNAKSNWIFESRDILWKQAINMFTDHPISGIGIGQYIFELPNYNLDIYNNPWIVFDNTCNLYLEILSEMGIFQLLVVLWFFVEVIIGFFFAYNRSKDNRFKFLLMNLLLSFAVMSLLYFFTGVTSSFAVRYLFFIVIGIIINLYIMNKSKTEYISQIENEK
jgi:O-antigen ligase